MLEATLVTRLNTITTNTYPLVAPKNYSTPCVVYQRLSTDPLNELGGWAGADWVWFQITAYDPSYLAAKTLSEEIKSALRDWQAEGIDACILADEHDMLDDSTETNLYCSITRWMIFTQAPAE